MSDEGEIAYPFSTREAVAVARHLAAHPTDGVAVALSNVFAFDSFTPHVMTALQKVLDQHGVPYGEQQSKQSMTSSLAKPELFEAVPEMLLQATIPKHDRASRQLAVMVGGFEDAQLASLNEHVSVQAVQLVSSHSDSVFREETHRFKLKGGTPHGVCTVDNRLFVLCDGPLSLIVNHLEGGVSEEWPLWRLLLQRHRDPAFSQPVPPVMLSFEAAERCNPNSNSVILTLMVQP